MTPRLIRRRAALAVARAALLWERAVAVWWPALAFPALFAVLAVAGLWARLGDPWRALALVASLAAAGAFAWRGWRSAPWPSSRDVRRRLEDDSALAGRPFEALEDTPAGPANQDPRARALWRAHRARVERALDQVRARRPRAALAARDATALRGVLTLGAAGALVAAGAAAPGRLTESLAFGWLQGGAQIWDIQAWVSPPEYTRRAPIFLKASDDGVIDAPTGSELVVRVVGARRPPLLRIETDDGRRRRLAFEDDGPAAHAARATLDANARVTIADEEWRLRALPDRPPAAAFVEGPEPGSQQELTFSYIVQDDYGVASAALRITLVDEPDAEPLERPFDTAPGTRTAEDSVMVDLTEHPWAGREVEARIVAVDALGQEGASEPARFILPERVFVDPLARAIVEQRDALLADASEYAPAPETPVLTAEDAAAAPSIQIDQTPLRLGRAPDVVQGVKRALDLMMIGADQFEDDAAVHLALAYAADRISLARERGEIADLPEFFWDAALRAEGGDLADAERAMHEAERALARALARGDDPAEIQALLDEYREAVNRYMDLLRLEALRDGRVMSDFAGGGGLGANDLQEMLQALRDLAETGSNDDARRMLAALSELLRNMQMTLAPGGEGGGGESNPVSEAMRQALEELAEVLGQQREAMDQTQLAESGAENPESGQSGGASSGAQSSGDPSSDGQSSGGGSSEGQSSSSAGSAAGERGEADGSEAGEGADGRAQGSQADGGGSQSAETEGDGAARGRQGRGGAVGRSFADRGAGAGGDGTGEDGEGADFGRLRDEQRAVREALRDVIERLRNDDALADGGGGSGAGEALDDAEDALKYADRAMERAEGALESGNGEGALNQQGQALEALREGLDALAEGAIESERRAAFGEGESHGGDTGEVARDPFGRNASGSGFDTGDSVRVPDEMERRRAREILDELRRRAGEAQRDAEELDYLNRLLDRF